MKFSQKLFDQICDRISDGESLRSICRNKDMPSTTSVMNWLNKDAALVEQYARAKNAQADTIFDECLHIADMASADEIQQARLRIDTRKWMAGKLRPKKYGERNVVEMGGIGGGPIQTEEISARDIIAGKLTSIAAAVGTRQDTGEPD